MEELDDIVILLRRFLAGTLTDSERERLERWSDQHPANRNLLESLSDEGSLFAGYTDYLQLYESAVSSRLQQIEDTLMESISSPVEHVYPKKYQFRWLPYAAAVLLIASIGTWFFYGNHMEDKKVRVAEVQDIMPGGNRATLTLTDGRTIMLDETQNGIVVGSEGITYSDGDLLAEVGGNGIMREEVPLLELTTPVGGTYQITLPDGTQVWLNAASTLRYPTHFSATERKVELSGEAYFSVTKDTDKPFKVISSGQEIQVLGTEFNVSAYPDDPEAKTTLVEGKVRLSVAQQISAGTGEHHKYVELVPGEQGVVSSRNLVKTKVDTELYTAWKNGFFYFYGTPLEDILRQAARWYDIEVIYRNGTPVETFSGDVSRNVSLRGFLEILQFSTIDVRLEGRTLIVN